MIGMVSVIVVNYNGIEDTCQLVDSFRKNETYPYEFVIVDNASPNGDGVRLQTIFPDLKIICAPDNLGFAGGNNWGYQYAEGEYILYMNNDMLIDTPFLEKLVSRLKVSDRIGLVSPKIKYSYAKDTIQYAGYTEMISIVIRNNLIGVNQKDLGQYDTPCQTAFAHGACMMASRKNIEAIGKMAESYFLFYEELDWSLQFRRAGYEIWFEPSACVYHKESMSIKRGTPLRQYYLTRSRLFFLRRNYSGIEFFLGCLYQVFFSLPKNIVMTVVKGQWKMLGAYCKGTWNGMLKMNGNKWNH